MSAFADRGGERLRELFGEGELVGDNMPGKKCSAPFETDPGNDKFGVIDCDVLLLTVCCCTEKHGYSEELAIGDD